MTQTEIKRYASWLGKRSYQARLERLGIERLQEIARENGKKGGRPRKDAKPAKASAKNPTKGHGGK